MAATLTGIVLGVREVEGVTQDGPRKGESWRFLSLEVTDPRFGHVWSCQLRDSDPNYADLLRSDLAGHKIKVTIKSQSAAERQLQDGRKVMQIRSQVTNVRDLGVADDED
jgi:hypothetical protein